MNFAATASLFLSSLSMQDKTEGKFLQRLHSAVSQTFINCLAFEPLRRAFFSIIPSLISCSDPGA